MILWPASDRSSPRQNKTKFLVEILSPYLEASFVSSNNASLYKTRKGNLSHVSWWIMVLKLSMFHTCVTLPCEWYLRFSCLTIVTSRSFASHFYQLLVEMSTSHEGYVSSTGIVFHRSCHLVFSVDWPRLWFLGVRNRLCFVLAVRVVGFVAICHVLQA